MSQAAIYSQIRKTVDEYLPGTRILLFGSHSRGDHHAHSDYDLLIITPLTLTHKEKINWMSVLDKALVHTLNVPFDVLINSEEEVRQKQQLPGHIIKSALKEGVFL